MFERDRRKDGVHDERTGSLSLAHKTTQDVPMPFARIENPCDRLAEPGEYRRGGLGCGQGRSNTR